MSLKIPDIIAKKRDGGCLSEDDIKYFVTGLTNGCVQDVQVGKHLSTCTFSLQADVVDHVS
ncbi:hypothetical protein RvY_13643 [Ramazzottius varieornatus]|uniref:Glycosyl transferase family 3 N-terminal domain-containing protein n=1 Tax=Ramazzottius varieornatus TaxID=947166 RepID=A0A1D1VTT4_RAMVA|nr:hypothetical protein RvY_13643 [Ramazzottius varieornatus]